MSFIAQKDAEEEEEEEIMSTILNNFYWCSTWDSLFWTFIDDYKNKLRDQYRFSMIIKNLEKMDPNKKMTDRLKANEFMSKLT